jgi:hypothetical protein
MTLISTAIRSPFKMTIMPVMQNRRSDTPHPDCQYFTSLIVFVIKAITQYRNKATKKEKKKKRCNLSLMLFKTLLTF